MKESGIELGKQDIKGYMMKSEWARDVMPISHLLVALLVASVFLLPRGVEAQS